MHLRNFMNVMEKLLNLKQWRQFNYRNISFTNPKFIGSGTGCLVVNLW